MKPNRIQLLGALLAFFLLSLLLIYDIVKVEVLEVEVEGEDVKLKTAGDVVLEYIHSVEGSKVVEYLEARRGCVRVTRIIWQGYGAGMPSSIYDVGENFTMRGDGFYEARLDRCLGESITINLDYMMGGTLRVEDRVIVGGLIWVRISRGNLLDVVKIFGVIVNLLSGEV